MMDLIEKGGVLIIPLMVGSVIVVAVILERFLMLRRSRVMPRDINTLPQKIAEDEGVSKTVPFEIQDVISAALKTRKLGRAEAFERVTLAVRATVARLERGLWTLELGAAAAPLVGLLGTVTGLVKLFNKLPEKGIDVKTAFTSGVSEALYTTVAGLIVGLIALLGHGIIARKIERYALEIELLGLALLETLHENWGADNSEEKK